MTRGVEATDRFAIVAPSPPPDEETRVLKQGDTFAVFDRFGDFPPDGHEQGLYHRGTRHLSTLLLLVEGRRPMVLHSSIDRQSGRLVIDLSNPDFTRLEGEPVAGGTVHIFRSKLLWQGTCYERVRLGNYAMRTIELEIAFRFAADFADLFEVRGMRRERRGRALEPAVTEDEVRLAYHGLDGVLRTTRIRAAMTPAAVSATEMRFQAKIPAGGEADFGLVMACGSEERISPIVSFAEAAEAAERGFREKGADACSIETSNERFDDWLSRSAVDLHLMITRTPQGPYPYAGIPWFSTPFGRDGILTAMQYLWVMPEVARGVLDFLAARQAESVDPARDAEPGKILHESREGEMAALGEVPFGSYYGSVDATPLFVMLAGAYYLRTDDRAAIEAVWPNVLRALEWVARFGDSNGDGFVDYERRAEDGLANQGWKDSADAVFHSDGSLAAGPIALCEVQAYCYAAWKSAAALAQRLEETVRARDCFMRAGELRAAFEQAFWCPDLSTYALALDGDARPCRVVTSNAGHCLLGGIAKPTRAARVAATLMDDRMYSGWGIRTVAAGEARYNPMSYHNGSVWPHDNALIATGLARYGLKQEACRILAGLFEAGLQFEDHGLPELFCGFHRRSGQGPTLYPLACAPQAWAAASAFALLQATLGLTIDAPRAEVRLSDPALPEGVETVVLRDLRVREGSISLELRRHQRDVAVNVTRRDGPVRIIVEK